MSTILPGSTYSSNSLIEYMLPGQYYIKQPVLLEVRVRRNKLLYGLNGSKG